jgi:hypothetical protein
LSSRQFFDQVQHAILCLRSQKAIRQDAALKERVELGLDESRQPGAGAGFGVLDEASRELLRQAIRGGVFRPVALVVNRGGIGHPLVPPADDLRGGLPKG